MNSNFDMALTFKKPVKAITNYTSSSGDGTYKVVESDNPKEPTIEELKTAWLKSKDKIRAENPYIVEEMLAEVEAEPVEESEVVEDGLQR